MPPTKNHRRSLTQRLRPRWDRAKGYRERKKAGFSRSTGQRTQGFRHPHIYPAVPMFRQGDRSHRRAPNRAGPGHDRIVCGDKATQAKHHGAFRAGLALAIARTEVEHVLERPRR